MRMAVRRMNLLKSNKVDMKDKTRYPCNLSLGCFAYRKTMLINTYTQA